MAGRYLFCIMQNLCGWCFVYGGIVGGHEGDCQGFYSFFVNIEAVSLTYDFFYGMCFCMRRREKGEKRVRAPKGPRPVKGDKRLLSAQLQAESVSESRKAFNGRVQSGDQASRSIFGARGWSFLYEVKALSEDSFDSALAILDGRIQELWDSEAQNHSFFVEYLKLAAKLLFDKYYKTPFCSERLKKIQAYMEHALSVKPTDPVAYAFLGRAASELGEFRYAMNVYSQGKKNCSQTRSRQRFAVQMRSLARKLDKKPNRNGPRQHPLVEDFDCLDI